MTPASTIHVVSSAAAVEELTGDSALANLAKVTRAALASAPEVAAGAIELVVFSCPTFTELGLEPALRRGLLDNDWNVKFVREVLWDLGLTAAQPLGCFPSETSNLGPALEVARSFMIGEGLRNVLVLMASFAGPAATHLSLLAPTVAGAGAVLLSSMLERGPELVDVRYAAVPEGVEFGQELGERVLGAAAQIVTELGFDTASDSGGFPRMFTNNLAEPAQRALSTRLGCSPRCFSRSPRWSKVSFAGDAFDNLRFGLADAALARSSRSVLLMVGRTTVSAALLRGSASQTELT